MYLAGARIHLPFIEVTKEVGDKVTEKELADAQQTDEDIQSLRKHKALLTEPEYEKYLKSQGEDERVAEIRNLEARLATLKEGDKE